MIQIILKMLVDQLNDFIKQIGYDEEGTPVVLGNIGLLDIFGGNQQYMQNKIVLSLVNIMEETTLKNSSAYNKLDNRYEISNPPTFLNLFLLFSVNFTKASNEGIGTEYLKGLIRLSQLIEFFQSKNVFTIQNSPVANNISDPDLVDIKINMELFSMTFEQINHLWGTLGGKQLPFVMYKAGIVPIKRDYSILRGEYIQEIEINSISK